jgi:signal transduction histidine kinase
VTQDEPDAADDAAADDAADDADVSSLDLASLLGEVVERLEDMRGASAHLQRLLEAVVAVAAGLELEQTLRRIVQVAADLVEARYGALGVLSGGGGLAEFVTVGLDDEQLAALDNAPVGRGILGVLIDDPTPLRLDDVSADPRAAGFPAHHPPMHSFLGVPVRVRGAVFGNLYLTDKIGAPRFTEVDEQVVVALAAAAGVAIENARLYEQARTRAAWLRASSEIATSVLRGDNTDQVLQLIATRSREASGAVLSAIALPDDNQELRFAHISGDGAERMVGRSTDDVSDDEAGPAMVVPMVTGAETLGMLLVATRPEGREFGPDDRAMAQAFADQAALALTLAEAQREHERLAILEDRDRIGRDLHDLVIQRLFATGMMLEGARRLVDQPNVAGRLDRAVSELDATILEVRSTIFALHESGAEEPTGLRGRLLREVGAAAHTLGFEPTCRFDGLVDSVVPESTGEQVIAALREALSNVSRHAKASWARVSVSVDDRDVVLIVTDDGVGLANASQRRSGLANLERRAEDLGGSFRLEPVGDDGTGTRLVWRVPVR